MRNPFQKLMLTGAGRHGPVVLMYHSISAAERNPDWPWAVSLRRFREHLDLLGEAGYAVVAVRDLAKMPERRPARTVAITFDDGYVNNLPACEELARRGMRATWFVVAGSVGREPAWPDDGRPSGRLLDASELRALLAAGMEIGSHSVSHARLPTLDDAALRHEVADSKRALEDTLGHEVAGFAYPYGVSDERCAAAVREAGYRYACTTVTGWATRDGNPYRLRRLTVFNDDELGRFARKLAFGSHDVGWGQLLGYWGRRLRARVAGQP